MFRPKRGIAQRLVLRPLEPAIGVRIPIPLLYSQNEEIMPRNTKAYSQKWYQAHKEERKEYRRKYDETHQEQVRQSERKRRTKPETRYYAYKKNAENSKRDFLLTFEEFMTFWQKPCTYCGDPIVTIGLDRIDNARDYVLDNVIPCCSDCNFTRQDLWTYQEMLTEIGPVLAKVKTARRILGCSTTG